MDGLEKKIQQEKAALDTLVPDVEVWLNISKEIPAPQKAIRKSLWVRYRKIVYLAAACMVGLLMVPGLIVAGEKKPSYVQVAQKYNPDFQEIQQYYDQKFEQEYASLLDAGIDATPVESAIKQLEADFEVLKKELAHAPEHNRSLIVNQMIQNMNNRVELLNLFYSKHKSFAQ